MHPYEIAEIRRDFTRVADKTAAALRDLRDALTQGTPLAGRSRVTHHRAPDAPSPGLSLRTNPTYRPPGFETRDVRHDGRPTYTGGRARFAA